MSQTTKILLVIGVLLVDMILFFIPLTALFLVYVILVNPPWFRKFINEL